MARCPAGHDSAAQDYCDVCGVRIGAPTDARGPGRAPQPCPNCATPRSGRFCEECGHDFALGDTTQPGSLRTSGPGRGRRAGPASGPSAPASMPGLWRAVVTADPAVYQAMADRGMLDPDALAFPFPARTQVRRVPLNKPEVHIGRRSQRRGILPEIDLGGPPEDVAVSHRHAVLLARPGGAWVIVDLGATNGTTINGTDDPITPHHEYEVRDGDRVYVGAWTVITLQKG
ncbi:FHA domain-containing protein [Nocardiopsis suaedae]|uniref:FHA domain-containing protein n=1 Tax=Nocardiopsis suaedae TaxID=3018444 RepID=A0ABT4THG7_9ACTN|nr:FHA domain-containing protein [Nocardiopsis suaedae]MDA2803517.1 FHA domain-containing protein [Nocardiopsis suaedae]